MSAVWAEFCVERSILNPNDIVRVGRLCESYTDAVLWQTSCRARERGVTEWVRYRDGSSTGPLLEEVSWPDGVTGERR